MELQGHYLWRTVHGASRVAGRAQVMMKRLPQRCFEERRRLPIAAGDEGAAGSIAISHRW